MLVEQVVRQHAEEAAFLWQVRNRLVDAPHCTLVDIGRWDARIRANIDGLAVAGAGAAAICAETIRPDEAAGMFAAASLALRAQDTARIEQLLALAEAVPASQRGLVSAFGWASAGALRGIVRNLLGHPSPRRRLMGVTVCALHRVQSPGVWTAALRDEDATVRARALRSCGEVGFRQSMQTVMAALDDPDPGCRFWAAWSAVLFGDRGRALETLAEIALVPSPCQLRSVQLAVGVLDDAKTKRLLSKLATAPDQQDAQRMAVVGAGYSGNPYYVPWLLSHMGNPALARIAGDAFSRITGLDFARDGFAVFRSPPDDDATTEIDSDDDLAWPARETVTAWWSVNEKRFPPDGRYLVGAPRTREQCVHVLKTGRQRDRRAAALHLALLNPDAGLFNTSASSWRQERLLPEVI